MTILITGATGVIGSALINELAKSDAKIHALTRNPEKVQFPKNITAVQGDMLDVHSMKTALTGISTLFLLNAVSPQELTEAMLTLNLAKEAGVKNIVYFSIFNCEDYTNVPHFASKASLERMIAQHNIPATILRANCFMQNDAAFCKDAVMKAGIYPFPIGEKGISMVDVRDIAEVAAKIVLARENSDIPQPTEYINLVGPQALTGQEIAKIWSEIFDKQINYLGNDTELFEKQLAQHTPTWLAMDLRLMLDAFNFGGMKASDQDVAKMTHYLGRSPKSYAEFAAECKQSWLV